MKIEYEKETAGYLDITFGPKWDYIALTRPYVENFLLINMTDKDNIHKVGTAASELLENATKFSGDDGIRMIVRKSKATKEVQLSVFNYLDKKTAQTLKERIDEMNHRESLDYYIDRMKLSVKDKTKSSQLGLARIYHEGQAKISTVYYEDSGIIEVRAVFNI
jgi:hypothetical protein